MFTGSCVPWFNILLTHINPSTVFGSNVTCLLKVFPLYKPWLATWKVGTGTFVGPGLHSGGLVKKM